MRTICSGDTPPKKRKLRKRGGNEDALERVMAMCKLVVGCFGLLMLIAADADVPQFLETMDKYESLWHEEKYDRLYRYIDVFAGENPKYIPAQLFLVVNMRLRLMGFEVSRIKCGRFFAK